MKRYKGYWWWLCNCGALIITPRSSNYCQRCGASHNDRWKYQGQFPEHCLVTVDETEEKM